MDTITKTKTENGLIAEFMGGKYFPNGIYSAWRFPDGSRPSVLAYHKSWDWLMPVVEKIAEYRLAYPKEAGWVCDCKVVIHRKFLYLAVVEFIKWYNEQNKTKPNTHEFRSIQPV